MLEFIRRNLYFDNWPMVLWQRAFSRRSRLLAFRRGPIEFVVDYSGGDQCGVLPCLTSDMYSRHFGVLAKERPLRIIDLGANAGGFCLSLLAAGFSFERIVCVEMNRRTWTRLQFNICQNFDCETVVLNAAIAGRTGSIPIGDSRGGTSESLYAKRTGGGKTLEVPLTTIDDLVRTHFGDHPATAIDLCKMDVEGAEYDIFQSPTCATIRRVKFLLMEIHPHTGAREADLIAKIEAFGFEQVAGKVAGEQHVYLFRNVAL
ncbi:MAG TPA: FkbM family methyltransferase [Verrucomicrobiae bacterium]|nr:FkbM family methyltransferase [Verrucomicrobiae bacterium]